MRSVPLSLSPPPFISRVRVSRTSSLSGERFLPRPSNSGIHSEPGVRGASQAVDLFPTLCPEIVVRDARLEDCWEVADTHCSTFFPNYTFPLDLLLKINRFLGLVSGFSVPSGCMRTCLVAVTGPALNENLFIAIEDFKIGGFGGKFSFNRWSVSGILTLDTVADFLPRKGPFRQRRCAASGTDLSLSMKVCTLSPFGSAAKRGCNCLISTTVVAEACCFLSSSPTGQKRSNSSATPYHSITCHILLSTATEEYSGHPLLPPRSLSLPLLVEVLQLRPLWSLLGVDDMYFSIMRALVPGCNWSH